MSRLVYFIVFLTTTIEYLQGAVVHNSHEVAANRSRAGICSLEVPTVDLLNPEDRRNGVPQGNGTRPGLSKIEVCCSGWTRKPHSHYECEPICDNGCENGNCTAPNVCTCHRGYFKHHDKCLPTCPIGCLNGVCTNLGQCSCNNNFELAPDGKFCVPHCTGGCGSGGECVGGEQCRCRPGFTLNREGKCEHHCEGGCGGGLCVAPNTCTCKPGYKGRNCVPDCPKGCLNGDCVAPNRCSCKPGWTLNQEGNICEAHCSKPCLNADCTGPDVCTCKNGYIKDPRSGADNKCVAHCPGGCENGQCSAPNFCICNPGFVKEAKGSNRCVRRVKRSAIHYELIPPQIQEQ